MALDNYEKELEAEIEKLQSERRMKEDQKELKKERKKLERRVKDARNKVKRADRKVKRAVRAKDMADRRRAKKLRADAKLATRERIRDKFWLFFAIFFGFIPVYHWVSVFAWHVLGRPQRGLPKLFQFGFVLRHELAPVPGFGYVLFVISVGCFVRFMIGKPNTTKDDASLNKPKAALKSEIFVTNAMVLAAIALAIRGLIFLLEG